MNENTKVQTIFGREVLAHDSLRMVTLTSAAMVIRECKAWSGHKILYSPPKDTVLGDLEESVNWANHGFVNALQSHVEIIYAYVKYLVDDSNKNFIVRAEALVLLKALSTYQKWKEDRINRDEEEMGHLTGFGKAVWNDLDEKLLAQYK